MMLLGSCPLPSDYFANLPPPALDAGDVDSAELHYNAALLAKSAQRFLVARTYAGRTYPSYSQIHPWIHPS
jgi:hypothetical protein